MKPSTWIWLDGYFWGVLTACVIWTVLTIYDHQRRGYSFDESERILRADRTEMHLPIRSDAAIAEAVARLHEQRPH